MRLTMYIPISCAATLAGLYRLCARLGGSWTVYDGRGGRLDPLTQDVVTEAVYVVECWAAPDGGDESPTGTWMRKAKDIATSYHQGAVLVSVDNQSYLLAGRS